MRNVILLSTIIMSQNLLAKSITCPAGTSKSWEFKTYPTYTTKTDYYLNALGKRDYSRPGVTKKVKNGSRRERTDIQYCVRNTDNVAHGPSWGYSQFPQDERAQELIDYNIPNTHHEEYWYISTNYKDGIENGKRVVWPAGNFHNRLEQNIKAGKRHGKLKAIVDGKVIKEENYENGKRNGIVAEYDLQGNIKRKQIFNKDAITFNRIYNQDSGKMSCYNPLMIFSMDYVSNEITTFKADIPMLKKHVPHVLESAQASLVGSSIEQSCEKLREKFLAEINSVHYEVSAKCSENLNRLENWHHDFSQMQEDRINSLQHSLDQLNAKISTQKRALEENDIKSKVINIINQKGYEQKLAEYKNDISRKNKLEKQIEQLKSFMEVNAKSVENFSSSNCDETSDSKEKEFQLILYKLGLLEKINSYMSNSLKSHLEITQ